VTAQNPRRVLIFPARSAASSEWIRLELRRRFAIEPVIVHLLGRCYLKGRAGDAANVILCVVGRNLRRILTDLGGGSR
jgi:IS5 family transposase